MRTTSPHPLQARMDTTSPHLDEAWSTHGLKSQSRATIMINALIEKAHNPQPNLSINEPSIHFVRLSDITTFDLTKLYKSTEPRIHDSNFSGGSTEDKEYSLVGAFMRADQEATVVVEGEEYQAERKINTRKPCTSKPIRKLSVHGKKGGSSIIKPIKGIPQAILDLCHQIKGCRVNKDGLPVRKALKEQMPDHFLGSHRLLNHKSPLFP